MTLTKKAGKRKPQVGYGIRGECGNVLWDTMDSRLGYVKDRFWYADQGERPVRVSITYTEIKPKRKGHKS